MNINELKQMVGESGPGIQLSSEYSLKSFVFIAGTERGYPVEYRAQPSTHLFFCVLFRIVKRVSSTSFVISGLCKAYVISFAKNVVLT